MAGLHDVVQAVSQRPGVQAVILASADGLTIEHAMAPGRDPDADTIAALTAVLAQHAQDLGDAADQGPFATGVLEFNGGLMVLAVLGNEGTLVLQVERGTDIGELLFDLHRHRPAVVELL
jgi:predicted regulator of Ras-like GTPase activity (Roadblock/LC7/MglB family)